MRSRIGVTILILALACGSCSAQQCRVVIDIPDASLGATLVLDATLYEVDGTESWVVATARPMIPGETLVADVEGPVKANDYRLENTLGVSYPSGDAEVVTWECEWVGQWVGAPGCDVGWE